MLFCRVPRGLTHPDRRGAARPDGITLWGRRATRTTGVTPTVGVTPVVRVWHRLVTRPGGPARGAAVGPAGLIHGVAPARTHRPGGYAVTSWGPAPARPGTTLPLRWVPVGTSVWGVPGGAARAPGAAAKVLRHRAGRVELRLPSRRTTWTAAAGLCGVGHPAGYPAGPARRAGDTHRRGGRPRVRGVAMNPVDHPHGGGQGKTSGGRPGVTPWGRLTRGVPTRRHPR